MPYKKTDILILGTGSLAKVVCHSLPLLSSRSIKVVILSRELSKAQALATVCNVRSTLSSSCVQFTGEKIDWNNQKALEKQLKQLNPEIVFHTSSLQSPWEFTDNKSEWSQLVQDLGYGITFPFQAYLALKIASALKATNLKSCFINACYPDLVNPFLASLGFDIFCGVGNVAILRALIATSLPKNKRNQLKLIAHHYHVSQAQKKTNPIPQQSLHAWLNEKPITNIEKLVAPIRDIPGSEINNITGLTAAKLLIDLFKKKEISTHVPGPLGLPGGYPVTIKEGELTLNLPKNISKEEAIILNEGFSKLDGMSIEKNGYVTLGTDMNKDDVHPLSSSVARFHSRHIDSILPIYEKFRNNLRIQDKKGAHRVKEYQSVGLH